VECSLENCFARFFGSFSLGVRFRLRSRVAVECSGGSIMRFVLLIGGLVFVLSFVRLSIQRKERIELTMNSTSTAILCFVSFYD
jgi:hypothetical protein